MSYKVRCSRLGEIMTEPQTKKDREAGVLSKTAQSAAIKIYAESLGKYEEFTSKYTEKGKECEEQSITLLSQVNNVWLQKNEQRYTNEFITGEPDLLPKDGMLYDIKTSWNLQTFLQSKLSKLNSSYYWQMQGYMDLTDTDQALVTYCLVNAKPEQIDSQKYYEMRKQGVADFDSDPRAKEIGQQVERNMIFNMAEFKAAYEYYDLDLTEWNTDWEIPAAKRIHTISIKRDKQAIEQAYERIEKQVRPFIKEHLELT